MQLTRKLSWGIFKPFEQMIMFRVLLIIIKIHDNNVKLPNKFISHIPWCLYNWLFVKHFQIYFLKYLNISEFYSKILVEAYLIVCCKSCVISANTLMKANALCFQATERLNTTVSSSSLSNCESQQDYRVSPSLITDHGKAAVPNWAEGEETEGLHYPKSVILIFAVDHEMKGIEPNNWYFQLFL